MARAVSPAGPSAGAAAGDSVAYFNYQWDPVATRSEAAFAIRTVRGADGRIVARFHESFKGIPTQSTDPKTGSHGH